MFAHQILSLETRLVAVAVKPGLFPNKHQMERILGRCEQFSEWLY